jgi:transposase-like protein
MKKTRYTEQEMQAAYNAWEQSGLSKKEYCQKNNLPRSAFFYWIKKLGSKGNRSSNSFQEIKIPKAGAVPGIGAPQIEIEYPSGVKLKLYQQAEASWIKGII